LVPGSVENSDNQKGSPRRSQRARKEKEELKLILRALRGLRGESDPGKPEAAHAKTWSRKEKENPEYLAQSNGTVSLRI